MATAFAHHASVKATIKNIVAMVRIDPEYYAKEVYRLRRIARSVQRENRGYMRSNGCILCGAHLNKNHTCGL